MEGTAVVSLDDLEWPASPAYGVSCYNRMRVGSVEYASKLTYRQPNRRRPRSKLRVFVSVLQMLILIGISSSVGVGLAMFISLSSVLPKIQDVEAPDHNTVLQRRRHTRAHIPGGPHNVP